MLNNTVDYTQIKGLNLELIDQESLLETACEIKDILCNTFDALEFDADLHKYTLDGKQLLSTTQFIGKYMKDFDAYQTSEQIAKAYNMRHPDRPARTGSYYRRRWDYVNAQSTPLGTRVHEFSETYPYFDEPHDLFEQGVIDFFKWFDEHYILITQEIMLYNKSYLKAGTTDLLALNKHTGGLAIFDWKTSADIFKYFKSSKLDAIFGKLPSCDLNKYSLQLSDYANMIELGTELVVEEMYIVWLHDFFPSFKKQLSASYKVYEHPSVNNGKFHAVYKCHDLKKPLLDLYKTITVSEDKRYTNDLKMIINKGVEAPQEESNESIGLMGFTQTLLDSNGSDDNTLVDKQIPRTENNTFNPESFDSTNFNMSAAFFDNVLGNQ